MKQRRNFLRIIGRSAAMVFFGVVTGKAMLKHSDTSQNCASYLNNCRDCAALGRCGFPRALSAKHQLKISGGSAFGDSQTDGLKCNNNISPERERRDI